MKEARYKRPILYDSTDIKVEKIKLFKERKNIIRLRLGVRMGINYQQAEEILLE